MSFFIIICMNYKTIGLAILILMAFVSVSAVFSADSPIVDGYRKKHLSVSYIN